MGGKIVFIIIIIIGLGLGLYLYSSGALTKGAEGLGSLAHFPSSSSSSSGGFSLFDFGSSTVAQGPVWPTGSGPSGVPGGGGTSAGTAPSLGTGNINPTNIPAGFTASQLSPYYGEVRLGSVSPGTSYYYGTIVLDTDFPYEATGTIDITGWQIKTRDSGEYIPQAIAVYDPTGLTPPSDIFMKNGDNVHLYSSSAPFNVRLNECIGYIAHVAHFSPPLPSSCPQPSRSAIQNFTGQCQNYIDSIGACQQPNMSSPQIPRTDYACQDYLENNFTYKSCFEAHDNDPNFSSNQVWVWTGSNVADPYHDSVELLDRNGLLVNLYTY